MIINQRQVEDFLLEHPNPKIVIASTIKDGFVSCIKPVPTICGAELMCSQETKQYLDQVLAHPRGR